MKDVLLMIWNGAFAVAIAAALSFGAAEALSGTGDATRHPNDCQMPEKYCDENEDCEPDKGICEPPLYFGGTCDLYWNCCVCFE
jgi:hypothetical protein